MLNRSVEIENRINYKGLIFCLYVIATMAIYILPYTKLVFPYIPVAILMLASIVFIPLKSKKMMSYIFVLIFSTGLTFSIAFGVDIVDSINEAIRNLRFFIPILWGYYGISKCSDRQKMFVLLAFAALTAYITSNTFQAMEDNPMIARILAQDQSYSSAEVNLYRLNNVGGYPFSYMMGIVTIVVMWLAFSSKSKLQKILFSFVTVICFVYIVQTMYATLLLLTSFGSLAVIFFNTKSTLLKVVMIGGGFVLIVSFAPLCKILSEYFEGSLLSLKFDQIYEALSGDGVDALGRRPELMMSAFDKWVESPLIGSHSTVASHSLVFELLQQSGLIGLTLWLVVYIKGWKMLYKKLVDNNIQTTLFNVCMTYFSVLSFLNDTKYVFDVTIATFFIVPVVSSVFLKKKKEVFDVE